MQNFNPRPGGRHLKEQDHGNRTAKNLFRPGIPGNLQPCSVLLIHYWIDEEGGCDERPSKPSGERLNVSYYDPCDAEDQAEIDRVMKVIKTAISESPVSIYQNYYNEDEGEEWIDGVFARGVHATEWGVDY